MNTSSTRRHPTYWGAGSIAGQPILLAVGASVFGVLLISELLNRSSWTSATILATLTLCLPALWLRPRVVVSESSVTFYSWFRKEKLPRGEALLAPRGIDEHAVWYMYGARVPFVTVPSGREIRLPTLLIKTPSMLDHSVGRYVGSTESLIMKIDTYSRG